MNKVKNKLMDIDLVKDIKSLNDIMKDIKFLKYTIDGTKS